MGKMSTADLQIVQWVKMHALMQTNPNIN